MVLTLTSAKKEEHYYNLSFRKGKPLIIIIELAGVWAMCQLHFRQSESEESLYHNHSSGTSSWESDVSVGNLFREFSVNMVSTSHLEGGDEETIQSDTDPWIKHLNTLWDIRFEQCEPPIEDKVSRLIWEIWLILSPSL